jgi:hypothetical protein
VSTDYDDLYSYVSSLRNALADCIHGRAEALREIDYAQKRMEQMESLLRDCADHFKTLRKHNIFVWPNHPMNPEARIAELLDLPAKTGS